MEVIMNRAAIYARLSLADERSTSTKRQEKDCRDHANSLGLEVVQVFTDEGISGYKDVERPAFDEAIEGLVRGDFDTLIVWKLDRLTRRGMGHIGTLLDRLDGSGRRIISKMDGVDTSQSQGRIMVALLSEMARSESQNTSVRLKAQRSEAREKGRISSGSPPWGMMTLEDGTIAPDPVTGPIARQAIDKILGGEKRMEVVRWLNTNGHFTKRDSLWSEASLSRWVTFPTLAGYVSHNPEKNRYPEPYRSAETGEIVVIGEGLITEAEFYEIRSRLKPAWTVKKAGKKGGRALSGVAFCADCGSKMYASAYYYYCHATRKGICSKNSISAPHLEELIGDLVISRLCALDPGCDLHLKVEKAWKGDGSDDRPIENVDIEQARLGELEMRMAALMEDRYVRGRFSGQEDLYESLAEGLQVQIAEQRKKIEEMGPSGPRQTQMDLTDAEIVREAWETASDLDKQAVTKIVIENITVDKRPAGRCRFQPERVKVNWLAA